MDGYYDADFELPAYGSQPWTANNQSGSTTMLAVGQVDPRMSVAGAPPPRKGSSNIEMATFAAASYSSPNLQQQPMPNYDQKPPPGDFYDQQQYYAQQQQGAGSYDQQQQGGGYYDQQQQGGGYYDQQQGSYS